MNFIEPLYTPAQLRSRFTEPSSLHRMHLVVSGPPPECLAEEVEDDAKETPQRDERHIGHNWGNISLTNSVSRSV